MKKIILISLLLLPFFSFSQITSSTVTVDATCFGMCDGQIELVTTGGTPPYTVNDPMGGPDITYTSINVFPNVCGGTWTLLITDAVGGTDVQVVTINEPTQLVAVGSSVNASCYGICDGMGIMNVTGGTPGYTYLWDDPCASTTAVSTCSGCPGVYQCTVTDANNCVNVQTIVVTEPAEIMPTVSMVDESSPGACDGIGVASATGGNTPYSYDWVACPGMNSIGQMVPTASSLCSGNYAVTVTDANGCTSTSSCEPVGSGCNLSTGVSAVNVTCNGSCDGQIILQAMTGTPPYIVNDPMTGAPTTYTSFYMFSNVCAGTYTLQITDAMGCIENQFVTIVEPTAITLSMSSTDETSLGACDGTATVVSTGGTPAYTYSWVNCNSGAPVTQFGGTINGLCPGDYNVTVMDGNGCSTTSSCVNIAAFGGCNVTSSTIDVQPTCPNSCDGIVEIFSTGGTAPYIVTDPFGSMTSYTSFVSLFGYCAGTYTFLVEDNNGCSETIIVTFFDPIPMVVSVTPVDESSAGACDGSVTPTLNGGTAPYTYVWENCSTGQVVGTAFIENNLCSGSYHITVTDNNGCSVTSACEVVSSPSGCTMATNVQSTDVLCYGSCDGTIVLVTTGGTMPYMVNDPMTGNLVTYTSAQTFANVCPGVYTFLIQDAGGCTETVIVTITEPSATTVSINMVNETNAGSCDGAGTATVSGGVAPYIYTWTDCGSGNPIGTAPSINSLCTGTYSVTVLDNNGCTSTSLCALVASGSACNMTSATQTSNALCNGSCDGTVILNSTGGTLPYIVIDPISGNTITYTGVQTLTGFCAGSYQIAVQDAGGCSETLLVTISEPIAIVTTTTVVSQPSGFGICDGVIASSTNGGTANYTLDWIDCDADTLMNFSQPTISGLCQGNYGVIVTDANGCVDTSGCEMIQNPVGIENATAQVINIYPNPASLELNIVFAGDDAIAKIYSIDGRLIYNKQMVDQTKIDISNWVSGIYLVEVISNQNRTIKKIRVQ